MDSIIYRKEGSVVSYLRQYSEGRVPHHSFTRSVWTHAIEFAAKFTEEEAKNVAMKLQPDFPQH